MESWTLIELESPTIQFNHAAHGGLKGVEGIGVRSRLFLHPFTLSLPKGPAM
jgi:hypothetical protein